MPNKVPDGKVIRTMNGGPDALKGLLGDVQKYMFNGLLKILNIQGDKVFQGFLITIDGSPKASFLRLEDPTTGQAIGKKMGREALPEILANSKESGAVLELQKVDSNALLDDIGGVNISEQAIEELWSKPAAAPKKGKKRRGRRRIGLTWGAQPGKLEEKAQAADPAAELKAKVEAWRDAGYALGSIEKLDYSELEMTRAAISVFEGKVRKLEALKEVWDAMDATAFPNEAYRLQTLLKTPDSADEAESLVNELEKKIAASKEEEKRARVKQLEDELRQKKLEKQREDKQAAVYDLVAKHMGPKTRQVACDGAPEELPEAVVGVSVSPNFTFDNFVVGESNQFAQAAALAVADNPGTAYNPLFIWSGPGMGKTHLLQAIANKIKAASPGSRIVYTTTEKFTNDLVAALQQKRLMEFRNHFRSVDLLIVDDIQFLADRERTQEEFFHTFNALYSAGKQIVLASDRPPKEIPTLEERLVSRFEGGLITDMQLPGFETRAAILRQTALDSGIELPDDVAELIAKGIQTNVRQLKGGLNKVVAFSTLMKKSINYDLAKEALKDIIGAPAPVPPTPPAAPAALTPQPPAGGGIPEKLLPAQSYLVEEERPLHSFGYLKKYSAMGKPALCISRTNPTRIQAKYKFENTEMYWLTDRDSSKVETLSYSLEKLIFVIQQFLKNNEGCIVLLDGVMYLIQNNSFDAVLTFMRRVIDDISEAEAIFLVSMAPGTLESQQLKILEREMEPIVIS